MPDDPLMFEALGNLVAFRLLGLAPGSAVGDAVQFFVMDVAKIFAMLVVVIYAMGLMRALLSPERVRAFVRGRPDWLARGLAVALGAVTPFCSCSSVPLFIGFVEAGIPLGVTFSFLIASPMINEVAAVLLVGILGWQLAALYVAAGVVVAWFGGIAMQAFRPERWVEDYVWKIRMGETGLPAPDTSLRGRHRYAVGEVTGDRRAHLALGAHRYRRRRPVPRLRAGGLGQRPSRRQCLVQRARRRGDGHTAVFQRHGRHPRGRGHAGQGRGRGHHPGIDDERGGAVAARAADPAQGHQVAGAGVVRGRARRLLHPGRLGLQPDRMTDAMSIHLNSIITCPACGFSREEAMPTDACVWYWECPACKTLVRPQPGDCCVYCSYGSVPCPPVQVAGPQGCCHTPEGESP